MAIGAGLPREATRDQPKILAADAGTAAPSEEAISEAVSPDTPGGLLALLNVTQLETEVGPVVPRVNRRARRLPVEEADKDGVAKEPDRALGIWPPEYWGPRLAQARQAAALSPLVTPEVQETAALEPVEPAEAGEPAVSPQEEVDPTSARTREEIESAFRLFGAFTGASPNPEQWTGSNRQLFLDQVQGGIGMLKASRQVALQLGSPEMAAGYGAAAQAIQAAFGIEEEPADLTLMPALMVRGRADLAIKSLSGLISQAGQLGQGPFLQGMQDFANEMQERLNADAQKDRGLGVPLGSVKRALNEMVGEGSKAGTNGRSRSYLAGKIQAARVFGAALGIEPGQSPRPLTLGEIPAPDFLGPLNAAVETAEAWRFGQVRGMRALAARAGRPDSGLSPAEAGREVLKLLAAASDAPGTVAAREDFKRHLWNEAGIWLGQAMQLYPDAFSSAMAAYNTLPGRSADDWTALVRGLEQVSQDQVPTGLEAQRRDVVSGLRHIFGLPENLPPRETGRGGGPTLREKFMARAAEDGGRVLEDLMPLADRANRTQVIAALLECEVDRRDVEALVGNGKDGPAFWAAAERILLAKAPDAFREMMAVREKYSGLPEPILREAWVRRFLERQRFFSGEFDTSRPVRWRQVVAPYEPAASQEGDERERAVRWIMGAFDFWQRHYSSHTGDEAFRLLYNHFVLETNDHEEAGLDAGQAATALDQLVKRVMGKSGGR